MVVCNEKILESYFLANLLRPRTQKSYRQVLGRFSAQIKQFGISRYEQVTTRTIEQWRSHEISSNQLSVISWNSYCRTLKALFSHAIKQKIVGWESNPFNGMMLRAPKKKKKTLADLQIMAINQELKKLENLESEGESAGRIHPVWFWRAVFKTLYYTGIRRNQLLHIRYQDVCLYSGTIFLSLGGSKTHQEHGVPIPEALMPTMEMLMTKATALRFRPGDQLFNVTRFGKNRYKLGVMQDANVSNCFRQLGEHLGFKVSPHRLRHTLGTNLMRQPEKNLHLVKEILGHTDIRTTLEYIVVDPEDIKKLLNTMPLLAN